MQAARLYGAQELRIDTIPEPAPPKADEILLRVTSVGICGSDLHTYLDGRIGSTAVMSPLVLGHEFAGVVEAVGANALDGNHQPLRVGQRVAVDPASPCWHCESCENGHPNLCNRLHFCGLYPDDGALREYMTYPARCCFPIPDSITDAGGALLEPMGVALHAVNLAKIKLADSIAVIGCGAIGQLIIQLAKLSGAQPIYAFDKLAWRVDKARALGADAYNVSDSNAVTIINDLTRGRGVDIVFEAAWADATVAQASEMARMGGRVILVGIPSEDTLVMKHSVARRKGLTIKMARRMKHTYPRSIQLVQDSALNLDALISHRYTLAEADKAFAMNAVYGEEVQKAVIDIFNSQ